MLTLAIADTVMVGLLTVLVAGLLRSHADILRALHELGVGIGDPSAKDTQATKHGPHQTNAATGRAPGPGNQVPLVMGPPLPAHRQATWVGDVGGVDPNGDALSVSVTGSKQITLLAFLSTGCSSCAGFWKALANLEVNSLPPTVRPVVVTKGPERESPTEAMRLAAGNVTVIMSSQAWEDYEVPGSPFFVLVDGTYDRRIGEGSAVRFDQVVSMVRQALDEQPAGKHQPKAKRWAPDAAGRQREERNDRELLAAGIGPGHPSLYPSSLADIMAGNAGTKGAGSRGARSDGPHDRS